MSEGEMSKYATASFASKWVPLFWNVMEDTGYNRKLQGIQIEPHEEKGVWLIATNAYLCVWVHDREGHASESMILDICFDMVKFCEPPEMPKLLDCNGYPYDLEPPDWAVPEKVVVFSEQKDLRISKWELSSKPESFFSLIVTPRGVPDHLKETCDSMGASLYHTSGRLHGRTQTIDRPLLNWRRNADLPAVAMEKVSMDFKLLGKLAPLGPAKFKLCGTGEPVLIEFGAFPEARAAIMPMCSKEELL